MKKNKTMIALFIAPTVISLLVMYLYPVTRTVIMSFFDVDSVTAGLSEWSFNGLANYTKIFHTASFIASMKNMLVIWLVGGIISLFLSMVMAVVLTSGIRGANSSRLPSICPTSSVPLHWLPCGYSTSSTMTTVC